MSAVAEGRPVYLAEGEKDVHALEHEGVTATTAPMGATSISKCDLTPLYGGDVIAVVDRDGAGDRWAQRVRDELTGRAKSLTFVRSTVGNDAADHVGARRQVQDFEPYLATAAAAVDVQALAVRRARITWANTIEPAPVKWAWTESDEGRIPAGSLSVPAGREGTGKSSFGIWMAAQMTTDALPGSFYGQPRPVFYAAVEDSWRHTLVPRLMAAAVT